LTLLGESSFCVVERVRVHFTGGTHPYSFLYLAGTARPNVGYYLLVFLALLILISLVILVEMVALQLLRWGNTRQSLRASLAMNLASSLVGIALLVLFPQPDIKKLLITWPILVLIEGGVMTLLRPKTRLYGWLAVVVANLASYALLILPVFLFRG